MIHPSNWFIYRWLQPSLIDLPRKTRAPSSECYRQWSWFFHQTPRLDNCCPATQATHSVITRVPLSASSQLWCVKTLCMAVWRTFKSDSPFFGKFISALQLVPISSQSCSVDQKSVSEALCELQTVFISWSTNFVGTIIDPFDLETVKQTSNTAMTRF